MPGRRFAALLMLAPFSLPAPTLMHVRLQGQFTMTGRVTIAREVPGEHVGDRVTRIWDFLAPCPAGQCATENLVRGRAVGTDLVPLERQRGMFGYWEGTGSYYAPLMCRSRLYVQGERVWFRITVTITGEATLNGVPVATSVKAHYSDYKRTNNTRCFAVLGHDAARYTGTLVNPVAPVTPVTPAPGQPAPTPAPG